MFTNSPVAFTTMRPECRERCRLSDASGQGLALMVFKPLCARNTQCGRRIFGPTRVQTKGHI